MGVAGVCYPFLKISVTGWGLTNDGDSSNEHMVNRTGHVFPDYTDPWSGKSASDGVRTDWVKIPKEQKDQQVPWITFIINQKRTEYENTYIHHTFDWSGNNYQLHHMRP